MSGPSSSASSSWIAKIDPAFVERRFGANAIDHALALHRVYVEPPVIDGSRLVAVIADAPFNEGKGGGAGTGRRSTSFEGLTPLSLGLSSPFKIAVRVREDDQLDVACACRHARICDHVVWLLIDVAFHPGLRAALIQGEDATELALRLPAVRARALEERTLDERLAAWLPSRTFDDNLEIDIDVTTTTSTANAGAGARSALLLIHRRLPSRSVLAAREVLALRLSPRHRRLVDLTAPYHLDRNALVAIRGQASLLIHLLREEIGVQTGAFKSRVRFSRDEVSPRVEQEGERLIARWYARRATNELVMAKNRKGDVAEPEPNPAAAQPALELIGDAESTFVFAGPFPYLWSPKTHTFYAIAPNVDLDVAMGMQRVPSLPIHGTAADRVGRALLVRGRGLGVALPPPEAFGLPPLEAPSFELRLEGTPLDVQAQLFAVYSAGKIPIGDDCEMDGRDREAEEHALALIDRAGLSLRDTGKTLQASEDRAILLWETGLASLRASNAPKFEVFIADTLARTKVSSNRVEVDVRVSTTAGWLDTDLEFRAGSLKVEVERLHQALAASKRWVVLSDGSLAKIAEDVATLVGDPSMLSPRDGAFENEGRGRIPPHQFGRIARWIELADQGTEAVRVEVDASVEALRARLRDLAIRPQVRLPSRLDASVTLRPYQRVGLAWLQLLRELGAGGLLADDMGLGKTLMTLAFLARWQEDEGRHSPSLVVCPTSVVGNWQREAQRFTPDLRVLVLTGAKRWEALAEASHVIVDEDAIRDHDLLITTYGLLRRDLERLSKMRFRCVVLDEAQNIKNPASETSRAARQLNAEMRLALTGTPVENRLSELWSLMTFANPGILGTAADFDARYERPIGLRPDGAVAAELRGVVRPFILRRTKGEVLADLPPKTEIDLSCVFGTRQKRLYDALSVTIREAIAKDLNKRKDARTQLSVLTAILRLRQMACDPRLVDPSSSPLDSAKRIAFLDIVRELVSEDRRALVFSQFVELLTLWRKDLDEAKVAYEYLDGSTTSRDAIVERFQSGKAPLFLISLKAGGAGLNLTAADTVIHCDPWWNPAAEDQATDRAHRIGQTKPVTVIRLVAQGTIEDKIALLKEKKQELAEALLGPDPSVVEADGSSSDERLGGLSEEDIRMLLGEADVDVEEDVPWGSESETEVP